MWNGKFFQVPGVVFLKGQTKPPRIAQIRVLVPEPGVHGSLVGIAVHRCQQLPVVPVHIWLPGSGCCSTMNPTDLGIEGLHGSLSDDEKSAAGYASESGEDEYPVAAPRSDDTDDELDPVPDAGSDDDVRDESSDEEEVLA